MIVRVLGWVFEKSSLQGIPWVSAWVGAHKWSRVVAYWLFPPVFWASVVFAMPAFVVGLVSLGEWLVYDLAPGFLPALLIGAGTLAKGSGSYFCVCALWLFVYAGVQVMTMLVV